MSRKAISFTQIVICFWFHFNPFRINFAKFTLTLLKQNVSLNYFM